MNQYFQKDFKEFIREQIGNYDYVILDPPWKFDNKIPKLLEHQLVYNLWEDNIKDLHWLFENIKGPKYVFLWTCNSIINEIFEAVRDTNWTYKTILTWIKQTSKGNLFWGLGNTFRNATEQLLVFQQPKAKPLNLSMRNVIMAPTSERTTKPKGFESTLINNLNAKNMKGVYIFCGNATNNLQVDGVDIIPKEMMK